MQDLKLQVSQKFYDQLAKGLKRGILLPNSGNYKNFRVDDDLNVTNDAFDTSVLKLKVEQVYYFETVLEALDMMGKKNLGYPTSLTSTQIEDKLLAIYGSKGILSSGVVVLEVAKKGKN